jgi:hypothetical protein
MTDDLRQSLEPRSDDATRADPGMYGSAANTTSDLLYEVGSWLHDVATGDSSFDEMHDSLDGRLVPSADAVLVEARSLAARAAAPFDRQWCPKALREKLCTQQTFAPDDFTRNEIQRLINVLDLHRPLGSDGKHGNLHTPTCGCEDR